jgi:hypothetical protein
MISGYRNTKDPRQEKKIGEIFEELDEDLIPLFDEVRPLLDAVVKGHLQGNYNIGRAFIVHRKRIEKERQEQGKTLYGLNIFVQLGVALDIPDKSLRECHQVATSFSPEEFQALIIENDLTWGHAKFLAPVTNPTRRTKLIKQIVKERMSIVDMVSIIRGEQPKKPRGPGRAPAKPRNLKQALIRLNGIEKTFLNTMNQALFSDAFDIPSEIEDAPPDTITPNTRKNVVECSVQLAEIEQIARDSRKRLETSMERIDEVLGYQGSPAQPAQA